MFVACAHLCLSIDSADSFCMPYRGLGKSDRWNLRALWPPITYRLGRVRSTCRIGTGYCGSSCRVVKRCSACRCQRMLLVDRWRLSTLWTWAISALGNASSLQLGESKESKNESLLGGLSLIASSAPKDLHGYRWLQPKDNCREHI